MTKEEKLELKAQKKAAKKAAKKNNKGLKGLAAEFKAFISRGSVIDMSIGVIIGGAFGAIVTAFTGILMSVVTWYVPGGIKGLVTVLPALNDVQKGMDPANGLGQKFAASELQALATAEANATYGAATVTATPTLIENVKSTILSKYTLHGTAYTYNMSAVIDWGSFINAIISFLIIAVVLFIILKAVNMVRAKNEQLKALRLEAHYKKHPEDRPVPAAPAPAKPSEVDLLIEIRDALAAKKA
ncbi:MAG: MscL family protein [Bacilli bacterium]|nr:MscL family protein [Bacilli bacterium]